MNYAEALSYINNYTWSQSRLGLSRIRTLLESMGNPQKKLRFIHVAGSNGKGSTCAMLASVLQHTGYKTGLYISPHIQDFCERISINGYCIDEASLCEITEQVAQYADTMPDHLSQFELTTAIAFSYFAREKCDIVLLETGMGGAMDATNVIDAPVLAILTNIGLEHTQYLGSTIEEITKTKAGIIKPGCECICYNSQNAAPSVIRQICSNIGVPFHLVDFSDITPVSFSLDGQHFTYQGTDYFLSLFGDYQLHNAATVLNACDVLSHLGWKISLETIVSGLSETRWPARMEILSSSPLFILDGGHNPQCVEALVSSLKHTFPSRKFVFIMGVLQDKNYQRMIELTLPLAQEYLCLTPDSGRALHADALAKTISCMGGTATAFHSYESCLSAVLTERSPAHPVVCFGSLYMAGNIRTIFQHMQNHDTTNHKRRS